VGLRFSNGVGQYSKERPALSTFECLAASGAWRLGPRPRAPRRGRGPRWLSPSTGPPPRPPGPRPRRHLAVRGRKVTGLETSTSPCRCRALPQRGRRGRGHDPPGPPHRRRHGARRPGRAARRLGQAAPGDGRHRRTIQREQDEIIRSPLPGVLLVQGGPGRANGRRLHRAAYLLYTHRFPLERQGVLVVGPNPLSCATSNRCCRPSGDRGHALDRLGPRLGGQGPRYRRTRRGAPEGRRTDGERPRPAVRTGSGRCVRTWRSRSGQGPAPARRGHRDHRRACPPSAGPHNTAVASSTSRSSGCSPPSTNGSSGARASRRARPPSCSPDSTSRAQSTATSASTRQ